MHIIIYFVLPDTVTLMGPSQGKNYHAIQNPCIPQHRNCQLKCEAFVTGGGGMCEFCLCQHVQHASTTAGKP